MCDYDEEFYKRKPIPSSLELVGLLLILSPHEKGRRVAQKKDGYKTHVKLKRYP